MLSKNNIKHLQALQLKKFREIHRQFIVEGEKIVQEAILHKPENIEMIYHTSDFKHSIPSSIQSCEIHEQDLKKISTLNTPNRALAVMNFWEDEQITPTFQLVLDTIQDPGNLGTIIRLADWYGVQQIVCSNETVDFRNSKVLQATMGSIFRVQISYCELSTFLQNTNLPIYGALLEGENVYNQQLPSEGILILGNEGKGISVKIKAYIEHPIHIPKIGHAESLNVSTATAILLSEFKREQLKR